jgi:hypothetical protein
MTRRKNPDTKPPRTASHRPGATVRLSCGHPFVSWGYTPGPGDSLWCRTCDGPATYPGKVTTAEQDSDD